MESIEALRCRPETYAPLMSRIRAAILGAPLAPAIPRQDGLLPNLRRGYVEIQEVYVAAFWPVVCREAQRYARAGGDVDDLTGEGALALWESVFGYAPTRHRTSFTRYVENHIHQRIRRAYRRLRDMASHDALSRSPIAKSLSSTTNWKPANGRLTWPGQ